MENFDWPIIGILATIIIPWTVYLLSREKKEISYSFTSTQLLSSSLELREDVDIRKDGIRMMNVHLVTFELINSGNFSIQKKDFARDIVLNFDQNSHVIELDTIETVPYRLNPEIINGINCIIIKPLKMRRKNCLKIKALVSNYNGFTFDFNFSGKGKIRSSIQMHSLSLKDKRILVLYAVVAGLFSLTLYKFNVEHVPAIYTILLSAMNINVMYFIYRILLKNK